MWGDLLLLSWWVLQDNCCFPALWKCSFLPNLVMEMKYDLYMLHETYGSVWYRSFPGAVSPDVHKACFISISVKGVLIASPLSPSLSLNYYLFALLVFPLISFPDIFPDHWLSSRAATNISELFSSPGYPDSRIIPLIFFIIPHTLSSMVSQNVVKYFPLA